MAHTYRLPNFLALLPTKPGGYMSPAFKEANDGYNAWLHERFGHEQFTKVACKIDTPLLAALAWPLASCKELRAVLDYMTASFILEYMTDHASSAEAKVTTKTWMRLLTQDKNASDTHLHPYLAIVQQELIPNVKDAIDPFHWTQFVCSNAEYVENVIEEAIDREHHVGKDAVRDIQSYMLMRRETIGTRPCFVLMRSTRGLYIPEHVLTNPVVREMEDVALDMIYITNDVYSFKKELRDDGALNNILTVMQKDPTTQHLGLQARLDHTETLFKAALERFRACREKLPVFDPEMDRQVSAYADGMVDWIAGNIGWSMMTPRYTVFVDAADRQNNIMRLDVGRPAWFRWPHPSSLPWSR